MLHLTTLQLEAIKREVEYQRARLSTMVMDTQTAYQLVCMAQELAHAKQKMDVSRIEDPLPAGLPEM